jgi:hypothetical protein
LREKRYNRARCGTGFLQGVIDADNPLPLTCERSPEFQDIIRPGTGKYMK